MIANGYATRPVAGFLARQPTALAPQSAAPPASVGQSGGFLVSPARTFQGLFNQFNRMYGSRWDEAIRNSRENARAMHRDAYFRSLEQERILPLTRWDWEVEADPDDIPAPRAAATAGGGMIAGGKDPWSADRESVRRQLESCTRRVPDFQQMR